ncbi:zinc ABC transporter substrate-binding protein [Planctomycetales bacterium ZRK34]|nr:zinc ABC transporter substrate-binding protein [Planctomycetales bacterium ZRK34]
MWTKYVMIVAIGAVLAVAGCDREAQSPPGGASGGRPVVVATIWPVASLVQQIVGEAADVRCLVPPGITPHGFEPTGRDAEAMRRCVALVCVGMNFDGWADGSLRRFAGKDTPSLHLAELAGGDHDDHDEHAQADDHTEHAEHAEHDDHDDHDHTGPNPHVWVDPVLMHEAVIKLGEQLSKLIPDAAEDIYQNTQHLADELAAVDAAYRKELEPFKGRNIVTYHNAFDRMAERYGLHVAVTLTPIDAPGAMTPKRMEQAIEAIDKYKLRVLFAEPQFPEDAASAVRAETGVQVMTLDPIGDANDPQRDTYQKLMRYNLDMLIKGLSIQ